MGIVLHLGDRFCRRLDVAQIQLFVGHRHLAKARRAGAAEHADGGVERVDEHQAVYPVGVV